MEVVAVADRHFAGTCTRMVIDHVEAKAGGGAVASVLAEAGERRTADELRDDSSWSSYARFRALCEAATRILDDPRCFDDMPETISIIDGSTPELVALVQALGSPLVIMEHYGDENGGIMTPIEKVSFEVLADTEMTVGFRFRDGFEPFPAFCTFMVGILGLSPKLFGLPVSILAETGCVHDGADHCSFHVAWGETSTETEVEALRTQVALLEKRVDAFRETMADLVSDDDLDTVLRRTIAAAARSTRAQAFVLALEPLPWNVQRVYAHGMDEVAARAFAGELLSWEPGAERLDAYIVEVESKKRRYGRLAAISPGDRRMEADLPLLRAFARVAAAGLDSALALEDSRRQAAGAKALLRLSSALAELTTVEDMAAKVVTATPLVVDCDSAALALIDDDGLVRIRAVHGFSADIERSLREAATPRPESDAAGLTLYGPDTDDPRLGPMIRGLGLAAVAQVPIRLEGEVGGYLAVSVHDRSERLLDNPELAEQLQGLAGQVSTALDNAFLLDQIRHQALHDGLTGLPNRALILDRAGKMLARSRRTTTATAALFLDLDGFKGVNDTLGHEAGDQLLRAVADRLSAAVREMDTVARLGGDEFVVLTEGATLEDGPELVAQRILAVMAEPFHLERADNPVRIGVSIGIAVGDRPCAEDLLRDADIALYQAKAEGKGRFVVFAPEMQAEVVDRHNLESDLRGALGNDEFALVYQPIFDLRNETVTGAEALLRWHHPTRGVVGPDRFIPQLEQTGLIESVGRWVLDEACRQAAVWHADGHLIDVSVNVSARQLESDQLVDDVAAALHASGLPATSLIVEVTETTIMRDWEATAERLRSLKKLGVRIAIDDFGTGYSSLGYLRRLPVDALKIDRTFISTIADSDDAAALIHTLVQLGKTLRLEVLAEGVESRAQFDHLQLQDCDSGQGFLFARPLHPDDLAAFLERRRSVDLAVG